MNKGLAVEYRAGLRSLLQTQGKVVKFYERNVERYPDRPEQWVSPYGWDDFEATAHLHTPTAQERATWPDADEFYHGCSLIIPEGVTLEELSYAEDMGTGVEGIDTVGVNAYGGPAGSPTELRCTCGKYRGLTVRWEGSLREALQAVLGREARVTFTI